MSVNITVNGKFAKHSQKHPLLLDREEARKEQEAERRKLRLLQVREQSKKFAENIRNNVKESMRKGLEKYEATKAEEYNAWRQKAMQQKQKDYREAVFQVGSAHRAAKAENTAQAEKKAKQGTYKDFKKQMASRRRNKENFPSQGPCICSKIHLCPNTQFQCACYQAGKNIEEPQKRKRDSCFSSSGSGTDSGDETSCEETLKDTSSSCSVSPTKSATTITSSKNRATQTSMICTEKNLHKTPAVYLDVEVGSEDSVVITAPVEINDKHALYNRQFSSIIRVSPRKSRVTKEAKTDKKQTQTTCTSADSRQRSQEATIDIDENVQELNQPVAKAVREKRFTLISDLVKKQQDQPKLTQQTSPKKRPTADANLHMSPRKFKALTGRPPVSRPVSQPVTPPVSPRKGSASSKSSKVISGGHTHPTSISAASANTVAMGSTSSSSCRVQFFDYNSKLAKEGTQTQTNARVNRQRESVQPTAMEQAAVENRIQYDRQEDILNKNKQAEERGQKALEREQVRRDCNELTEKLEALTRQYPRQVPTNENASHIFVDKQLRKEDKMNSAVEQLLNRPNIITCSEITHKEITTDDKFQKPKSTNHKFNEINVGAPTNKVLLADDVSSDSCCSILLGYVDDQSRQVRKDLEQCPDQANSEKQQRLKNLMKRLDQLRNSLMMELRNASDEKKLANNKSSDKDEHYLQLIEDITKYRQERETIMIDDIVQPQKSMERENRPRKEAREQRPEKNSARKKTQQKDQQPLNEREKVLQQKEAILEDKLREFYELQKQQNKKRKSERKESISDEQVASHKAEKGDQAEDKENINCTSLETPVEIVITVQGETKCIKIPGKSKKKITPRKNPTLATLIRSPQSKGVAKKTTPKKKVAVSKENPAKASVGRQNSYDSNSTSYMSLPPHMVTELGVLVDKKQQQRHNDSSSTENTQISVEFDNDESNGPPSKKHIPHLNPLVAQYVQRLLGMSRKAIKRLGVSSSDIDTPSSTLINTSDNNATSDSMISDDRLAFVESFVQENRSFIKELEQSLRAQKNTSLENSMRTFDEIWRKRLKQQPKDSKPVEQKTKHKIQTKQQLNEIKSKAESPPRLPKGNSTRDRIQTKELQNTEITSQTKRPLNPEKYTASKLSGAPNTHKNIAKTYRPQPDEFESSPENCKPKENYPRHRRPTNKVDKAIETKRTQELNKTEPDSQIARYAQLTENCTHRIAELTELINRVREEKQRLLEVTLSSVSDNGRQSTEYLELPEGKSRTTNEAESSLASSTEDVVHKKPSLSVDMAARQIPKLSALEKNRHITASQDSGIAESRPITAQENRTDLEPMSHTSTESQSTIPQRKLKPPPTLRRFSPQFQEDDLIHELSTILEVDTPANSRINTAVGQTSEDRVAATVESPRNPTMFPTFEEYVEKLNLDITQLDAERSMQLREEFSHFIQDLQKSRTKKKDPKYNEFPSISGYMNHSKSGLDEQTEAIEDSLSQLRLSGLQPSRFPAVREYVQLNKRTTSPPSDVDQQLLDTESLENITENESASLDIEKELKNRKILKNSFRYTNKSKQIFSSTAHQNGGEFYNEIMAAESGLEKLSTSDNTMAILETDLKRMVYQWPADGKKKNRQQQYQALSSTTTSTYESKQEKQVKSTSLDASSNEMGRSLNLRDFLTRELLKHANFSTSTSTTSSSDDSLRSQFLYSLIGTLTPRTNAATSKSGQHTLERQKTSTPVPIQSSQTHSTPSNPSNASSSQLFSGESRISSVHCYDRSAARLQTSDGGVNADQSSE